MATPAELMDFQKQKLTWKPFVPLASSFIAKGRLREPIESALSGDILDKHAECEMRRFDKMEAASLDTCLGNALFSNRFADTLANHKPIPLRMKEVHVVSANRIKGRTDDTIEVVLYVDSLNGEKFPLDKVERKTNEKIDHSLVMRYIMKEPWYPLYTTNRIDATGLGPSYLDVKLSYRFHVSDALHIGMHYKVCAGFCHLLEPLTLYWHSLMTESWSVEGVTRRLITDHYDWLKIEKTALLVIFFLQQCQLIPLLLRTTDALLPANLSLRQIHEADIKFFSPDYHRKILESQKTNPFAKVSVGTLFVLMLHFYTETCPLDKMKILFDQGGYVELQPNEKNKFIIETVLIRDPEYPPEKELMFKSLYTTILRTMAELLQSSETSAKGLTDILIDHRLDLEIDKACELRDILEERENNR